MNSELEVKLAPPQERMKDALLDVEQKLIELDDMHRKGMVTHQQRVAIKNRVHQWYVDFARQVL